ncbi:hypothetical protein PG630_08685 [Riemerella anatipestifer]|nr:hypothetical protein [Riemerella anatipestifer]
MKKNILTISALLLSTMVFSQVNVGSNTNTIPNKNTFLDASDFTETAIPGTGKGLNFPRTNLTTFAFNTSDLGQYQYFKTGFDGLVVYNTATGKTGSNTATQGQQVDVTPGFYYFSNPNATEDTTDVSAGKWVRLNDGANQEGQEWVYDATTNRINLKRSGGNLFGNTIFYNKKGARVDYDTTNIDYFDANQGTVGTDTINPDETYSNTTIKEITGTTNLIPDAANNYRYALESKSIIVKDTKDVSGQYIISGGGSSVRVAPTNTKGYLQLRGTSSAASHDGSGDVRYIIGGYFDGVINRGKSTGYVTGVRATATYATNQSSLQQVGVGIFNSVLPTGAGNINSMIDIHMMKTFRNTSALTVNDSEGVRILYNNFTGSGGAVSITNARGLHYLGLDTTIAPNNSVVSVVNNYGLYLGNIKGGTQNNYAIYTNAGKVRFGDNVGIGVDAPTEKLEIDGKVKATAFMGASGATIFPDYVFQKYYTGTSSLKADYNFKTLSQVEDFVKTNGHLPGYKSAAEIKKQGYIDLMATQLTNVEKIEELYLHLLEKDKEVKALKAKNEELETRLEQIEKLLK